MKKTLEQKLLEAEEWFRKHPSVRVKMEDFHQPSRRVFPAEEALRVLREQEKTLRNLERKLRLIRKAERLFLYIKENAPDSVEEMYRYNPDASFRLRGEMYSYEVFGSRTESLKPTPIQFKRAIRILETEVQKQKEAIQTQKAWINKLLK